MEIIISVIIPVYNKEKYLARCLTSVVEQTIASKMEIITIDDGSTDNSFTIMQEYQKKYFNVNIFKHANIGVGATRNRGISLATGKYIYFVDADDFIETNMLEILLQKTEEEESDITVCKIHIYNDKTKKIFHMKSIFERERIFERKESLKLLLDTAIGWSSCNKLYNLEFIRTNNILSKENIYSMEDFLFNLEAFLKVNRVAFVDQYLYYYVKMVETSLTRKPNPQFIEQGFFVLNQYKILSDNTFTDNSEEKDIIEILIILNILATYYNCVMNGVKLDKKTIDNINRLVKDYFNNNQLLLSKKISRRVKLKILFHRFGIYPVVYKIYYFLKQI